MKTQILRRCARAGILTLIFALLINGSGFAFAATPKDTAATSTRAAAATFKLSPSKIQYYVNDLLLDNSLLQSSFLTASNGIDYLPLTPESLKLLGLTLTTDKTIAKLGIDANSTLLTATYVPANKKRAFVQGTKTVKRLNLNPKGEQATALVMESNGILLLPMTQDVAKKIGLEFSTAKGITKLASVKTPGAVHIDPTTLKSLSKASKNGDWTKYTYNANFMILEGKDGKVFYGQNIAEGKLGYGSFNLKDIDENIYFSGLLKIVNGAPVQNGLTRITSKDHHLVGQVISDTMVGKFKQFTSEDYVFELNYDKEGELIDSKLIYGIWGEFKEDDDFSLNEDSPLTPELLKYTQSCVVEVTSLDENNAEVDKQVGVLISQTGLVLTTESTQDNPVFYRIDGTTSNGKPFSYYTETTIAKFTDMNILLLGSGRESDSIPTATESEELNLGPLTFLPFDGTQVPVTIQNKEHLSGDLTFLKLDKALSGNGAIINGHGNLIGFVTKPKGDTTSTNALAIPYNEINAAFGTDYTLYANSLYQSFESFLFTDKNLYSNMTGWDHETGEYTFHVDYNAYDGEPPTLTEAERAMLRAHLIVVATDFQNYYKLENFTLKYDIEGYTITLTLFNGKIKASTWTSF